MSEISARDCTLPARHPALARISGRLTAALPLLALSSPALAGADTGDTAWMLTSMALVLLMTIPGLALFYAGMVRSKNVLSVMMQCFAIVALTTLLWVIYGYSLAFDATGMAAGEHGLRAYIGGFGKAFLGGVERTSLTGTIPETVFIAFQLTFAAITPALIVGAFAERMRFSALLIFVVIWFTSAYLPIAHMTWAGDGGLFWDWGVLDFAGGTVVHINAGIAGLVACLVIGPRRGYPQTPMPPHNLTYTLIGASLLWVGWFGFNAGSAAGANEAAGMAMLVTQIATAAAALAWMAVEWATHRKPSVLGIASGAVAGLVAITPAAGTAGPMGAIAIGLISGLVCFFSATRLKRWLGYDDSLDVFGVHGVGGLIGAILTGLFADKALGGAGLAEGVSIGGQMWTQLLAALITCGWSALVTWLALVALRATIGLRVNPDGETEGLDLSLHDERGYSL